MVDISKCSGEDCNIKEECYRYTCHRSCMQSFIGAQFDFNTGTCPKYMECRSKSTMKRLDSVTHRGRYKEEKSND